MCNLLFNWLQHNLRCLDCFRRRRYHRAAIAGTDCRADLPSIAGTGDAHICRTTITGADCRADRAAAETNNVY